MCFWNPSREYIQQWVESKEKEFAEKENRNPRLFVKIGYKGIFLLTCMKVSLLRFLMNYMHGCQG